MTTGITTQEAAHQIGVGLAVLRDAGVCDPGTAIQAALAATPKGDTPERHAVLDGLATDDEEGG